MTTHQILVKAKACAPILAAADGDSKNRALAAMADALVADTEAILAENALDMEAAKAHISTVMLDRLALTPQRIHAMAEGIRQVAKRYIKSVLPRDRSRDSER